jgi:hypothetical protein
VTPLRQRRLLRAKNRRVVTSERIYRIARFLDENAWIRAWVRINQSLAIAAILIATAGVYVALKKYDADDKRADEDRIASAWAVVRSASGKSSNGGQVAALERLVSFKVPLKNVDLSNTFVSGADLQRADLLDANFAGADMVGVNLQHAMLVGTNFKGARLAGAKLGGSRGGGTNFDNAILWFAELDVTTLADGDFADADLTGVKLVGIHPGVDYHLDPESRTLLQAKLDVACGKSDEKFSMKPDRWYGLKLPTKACPREVDEDELVMIGLMHSQDFADRMMEDAGKRDLRLPTAKPALH